MDSNSQSPNSADPHSYKMVDIIGAAIALLTLTLPLFLIGSYSSTPMENVPPLTYNARNK
ncbi:MAG: hypothetical protein AAF378_08535 [Cyanobacteria bacterium P01_A01_bin.84]